MTTLSLQKLTDPTPFARPVRSPLPTILQAVTVATMLLLGAAFASSMFTESAEEQLRAALAPAPIHQVRS